MTIDTLPQRTVVYNDIFEYQGHPPQGMMAQNKSRCHLLIVKPSELADTVVVIATELASNSGKSITNSSEYLATEVVKRFSLDPEHTRFLEHYDDKTSYGYSGVSHRSHYSFVEYEWIQGNKALTLPDSNSMILSGEKVLVATRPVWAKVAYEQVLRLLDTPIMHPVQLLSMPDYVFLAIIDKDKDATGMADARQRWLYLPTEVPDVVPPDLNILEQRPSVLHFARVLFVYGVARDVPGNVVFALHSMDATGLRLYAVSREFEKSL